MPTVTNDMIHISYGLAKKVYEKKIAQKEALNELSSNYDMNRNSAADYFHNYACMIEGRMYARTSNAYGTEYYLNNIFKDGGRPKLLNALSALHQHIDYYEAIGRSTLHTQRAIFDKFSSIANVAQSDIYPDEVEEYEGTLFEGKTRKVSVNIYERNPIARQQCIDYYGCKCCICQLDFECRYGMLGKGFIHVHHVKEISAVGKQYSVDPIKDLRPVCPNCHAMLHRKKPAYSIEEVISHLSIE